jgi:hypothetical protein
MSRPAGPGIAFGALAAMAMLAAAAIGPAAAATLEAEIAGHRIVLPVPEGYCTLDRSREFDRELDERIDRVMSTQDVYLGAAIDCAELAALEDAPEDGFTSYLIWMAAGDGQGGTALDPDVGRAEFVEAAAAEAVPDTEALSEEATQAWQEELDSDALGIEALELGVIGHDDNAYYVTGLARIEGPTGTVMQAGITIGTLVHGAQLQVILYRPFAGERTFEALEPQAKALAASLVAANPDSDPGGGALGTAFGGIGLAGVRGALIGALIGGAVGLVVWLVKRGRRPPSRRFD